MSIEVRNISKRFGPAGLVIGLLSGSVVFLALGALLRILPADDARWLDESVGGRYGRLGSS